MGHVALSAITWTPILITCISIGSVLYRIRHSWILFTGARSLNGPQGLVLGKSFRNGALGGGCRVTQLLYIIHITLPFPPNNKPSTRKHINLKHSMWATHHSLVKFLSVNKRLCRIKDYWAMFNNWLFNDNTLDNPYVDSDILGLIWREVPLVQQ